MVDLLRSLSFLLLLWSFALYYCVDFQKDVLDEHNKFREVHGIPTLKIDETLTKKAEELAKKASASGNLTKPQPGENTYMVCTSYNRAVTAKEAVEAWYDEVCNDGFSFEYPNDDNAHAFTQAMWKDSLRLGVAKSTASDVGSDGLKCTFIIALYRPPGNIELTGSQDRDELFKENVFKGNFNYSYCDKFNSDSKRRHIIEETVKPQTKVQVQVPEDKEHHMYRRTLYYKIPAKFYIDPATGRTKVVSALGERLAHSSSLLSNGKDQVSVIDPDASNGATLLGSPKEEVKDNTPSPDEEGILTPHHDTSVFVTDRPHRDKDDISKSIPGEEFDAGLVRSVSGDTPSLVATSASTSEPAIPVSMTADARTLAQTFKDIKKEVEDNQKLEAIALKVHNSLRKIHGSKPLQLSNELSRLAQVQAESNAALRTLTHASDLGLLRQGENLAYNCKGENEEALIQDSIRDWYNEVCKAPYDFNSDDGHDALHFTQVVWNATRQLGCGKAVTKRVIAGTPLTCTYFCCRYGPTGNIYGEFKRNVIRGSFQSSNTCETIPAVINGTAGTVSTIPLGEKVEKITKSVDSNHAGVDTKKMNETTKSEKKMSQEDLVAKQEEKLQLDALHTHNYLRLIHGSQPLVLDSELSKSAKSWAKYIASTDSLKHSKADDYGENIAYSCSGNKVVAAVNDSVNDWYDEVCAHKYDFRRDLQPDTLHFTQLLWNQSKSLGIGMATSINNGMYCTYFVAQYKPKGNIIGHFAENIRKGGFDDYGECGVQRSDVNKKEEQNERQKEENLYDKDSHEKEAPDHQTKEYQQSNEHEIHEEKQEEKNDSQLDDITAEDISNSTVSGKSNSSSDLQDQDEKDYEYDAIKVLNKIREIHDSPELQKDLKLHNLAKERAVNFVTGSVRMMKNQTNMGEIVQVACNPLERVIPPEEAVANWYSEVCVKGYDFNTPLPQSAFHFTQLIWKASKRVGIAYATKKKRNGNLCTVVIALFEPGGNVESGIAENIQKGSFDKSFCGSINSIAVSALDSDVERSKGHEDWFPH